MEKLLKVADLRALEKKVSLGEISYIRMVEIINEKAFLQLCNGIDKRVKKETELLDKIKTLNECWANEIKLRGVNLIEIDNLKSASANNLQGY